MDVNANDTTATIRPASGVLGFDRLAQLLGKWQATELRAARVFPECRGLSTAELEDLYQDTALALLARPYASEEHLRNALRQGIRHRALNMHRDQRRRNQILAEHAPAMHRTAKAAQTPPDEAALAQQDRLIAKEFLAELDPLERQVFALEADGMRYRAIATALSIPVNAARTAARSCERKRARFQLLYETGRLCGYRATTIEALRRGDTAATADQQARAHLAACPHCRTARSPRPSPWQADTWMGAVAGVVLGALHGVRRPAGSGGVAAKLTAVAVTAVVAGSTIAAENRMPPTPHGTDAPAVRGDAPIEPRPSAAPERPTPRQSSPRPAARRARSTATPAPLPTNAPKAAAMTAIASTAEQTTVARAAEREFGPER